jgi:hypothetical protein
MSNHIRGIIVDALRSHGLIAANYPGPVDALAEALTDRAYDIVDAIAERGVELGHDEGEVRRFLAGLGLPSRREIEVQPELEPQDKDAARIDGMEHTIVLLAAAVEKLTRIAEQQHGVSEPEDAQG